MSYLTEELSKESLASKEPGHGVHLFDTGDDAWQRLVNDARWCRPLVELVKVSLHRLQVANLVFGFVHGFSDAGNKTKRIGLNLCLTWHFEYSRIYKIIYKIKYFALLC